MNSFWKYFLSISLATILLVSTTGIAFVVHHCATEHTDYVFICGIAEDSEDCTPHHHHGHAHVKKGDCCVNEFHFAKLEADLISISSEQDLCLLAFMANLFPLISFDTPLLAQTESTFQSQEDHSCGLYRHYDKGAFFSMTGFLV